MEITQEEVKMTNDTLKYLIDNSVRVTSAMIAISPQFFHEEVINVSKIIAFYPGCYAIKNSTIAYVYGARFYVTPYTRRIMQILKDVLQSDHMDTQSGKIFKNIQMNCLKKQV